MNLPTGLQHAHRLSIAPMMKRTDRHFRYFLRLISKEVLLYTEMITTGAILFGDRQRFLQYDDSEHPVAIQLGGSEPEYLQQAAIICEDYGYDEINLNVGCPSDRVQAGKFGACLMKEPETVAECIAAMNQVVKIPVTVKCRIGVDDQDSFEELLHFIKIVEQAGCNTFIIHARKAWLQGLSPKENRTIPPIQYDTVYQLKKLMPHLFISMNGEVKSLQDVTEHLKTVDGVMIGREAYANPFLLAEADRTIFQRDVTSVNRKDILLQLIPYLQHQTREGLGLHTVIRHVLGLFQNQPHGKQNRRWISENVNKYTDAKLFLENLVARM